LNDATLEEDEDLQTIWANLLANASDVRRIAPVSPAFPGILRELTIRDVKFLDVLYTDVRGRVNRVPTMAGTVADVNLDRHHLLGMYAKAGLSRQSNLTSVSVKQWDDNRTDYEADMREFDLTMDTLLRHRILEESVSNIPVKPSMYPAPTATASIEIKMKRSYSFTNLGVAFVSACRSPEVNAQA
jgi:hypothetical protein